MTKHKDTNETTNDFLLGETPEEALARNKALANSNSFEIKQDFTNENKNVPPSNKSSNTPNTTDDMFWKDLYVLEKRKNELLLNKLYSLM